MRRLLFLTILVVGCDTTGGDGAARAEVAPAGAQGEPSEARGASLVPSREEDQARRLSDTARDLARTLESLDGVVGARVHLGVARRDPFAESDPLLPSASVLLRVRSGAVGLADAQVQALVAAAVPGLAPSGVVVVRATVGPPAPELVRVGPFTTTRESAPRLRASLAVLSVMNIALVVLLLGSFARGRRPRERAPRVARAGR